jgi:hypothetical protein
MSGERLSHNVVPDGVASQFDVGGQAEFLRDSRAIGCNRFFAEHKFCGDFLQSPSECDHAENLQFAVGQRFARCGWNISGK